MIVLLTWLVLGQSTTKPPASPHLSGPVQTIGVLVRDGSNWNIMGDSGRTFYLAIEGRELARLKAQLPRWEGKKVKVKHRPGKISLGSMRILLVNDVLLYKDP